MSCYEAVKSFKPVLPISSHMFEGLKYAIWRMRDGISGYDVRRLEGRSCGDDVDHDSLVCRNSTLCIDSEEIVMTHYLRVPRQPQSNLSGVSVTASMKREEVKLMKVTGESRAAAIELSLLSKKLIATHERQKYDFPKMLCGQVIDRLYPISHDSQQQGCVAALRSPLSILSSGRDQLCALLEETKATSVGVTHKRRSDHNKKMLKIVNKIRTKEVDTCINLLGAFMQQQEIAITLSNTTQGTSVAFSMKAAASVGVWALFSLDYSRVLPLLDRCKGRKLLVNIEEYIDRRTDKIDENSCYAAKLQFMVQEMLKTVTCNSQYISYSFERQLMAVCTERNIDAPIPLDTLFKKWDIFFKGNTLSLVHKDFRRLIAHWMKWALMIHCLREKLAKYTAIGVVGLVNSGKSKLVNTLFGIQIPVGTAEASRTTVPFLYNLDEHVEGLDVVDFPGVDDEDDTISGLADLLVTIAQIVIFVTDYRRAGSKSAKQWLDRLQREKVPVLVCLTFADKFYAEHMTEDGQHPKKETMKDKLEDQLFETRRKIGSSPSRKVQFFSFSQDRDSVLNSPDGRQRLEEVGIGSPRDVGAWLVRVFQRDFGQEELASQLEAFIDCPEPDCRLS